MKSLEQLVAKSTKLASKHSPILVAFDGRSGVGKSYLSKQFADSVGGVVVEQDSFHSGGTVAEWNARSTKERYDRFTNLRRLRSEVLEPLLEGKAVSYHPFDWKRMEGLARKMINLKPQPIIVLDGAYSTRPELQDLVDLSVLVTVPDTERKRRLSVRDGATDTSDWHSLWSEVSENYFTNLRPPETFDVVIENHPNSL